MTTHQQDILPSESFDLLRPSHRTFGEQILGFFIYLLVAFALFATEFTLSAKSLWILKLNHPPWVLSQWTTSSIWAFYQGFIALSMWLLWRRHSLKKLKLELALYINQIVDQIFWIFSIFYFQEPLLALVFSLFLWFMQLIALPLYWKKEKSAALSLAICHLWSLYILAVHMALCIRNP